MNIINAKAWADDMDVAVTVCDDEGIIVYMNKASILSFHKYGGADLIGQSLMKCHNALSQERISEMLKFQQTNIYIINKENERRLIRQFPWVEYGEVKGIIEMGFKIPAEVVEKKR